MRRPADDETGSILVVVVGTMLILGALAMTGLAYTVSSQRFARYDQDYSAAMAAAQSGVDDFISRINQMDAYGYTPDCTNLAWRGPMAAGSNSCGWNTSTSAGWLPVEPGETKERAPHFHYEVDSSRRTQGTYRLVVTGRANGVFRTIDTTVGKGGSTDYVYYTDFESADPNNVQAYGDGGTTRVACGRDGSRSASYWHSSPSRSGAGCTEITFIGGDVLDGEVFTNDTIYGSMGSGRKPEFQKQVWTADPRCATATAASSTWESRCLRSGSVADFSGIQPKYHDPLYLPDNSGIFATTPGCHYFGSTRVVFKANGTMTVWNKTSVNGGRAPVADGVPGGSAPSCGTLAALNSTSGATVAVPTDMVIYVDHSGTANRQCYGGELGGPSGQTLPVGTFSATLATHPTSSSTYTADENMLELTKQCGQGNLYAEGVLNGRVTLASAQSIVVTGDLVLAGGTVTGTDLLGLVATNSVEVFHPRQGTMRTQGVCTRYYADGTCRTRSTSTFEWKDQLESVGEVSGWPRRYKEPGSSVNVPSDGIQIAGSIQTLLHSFYVQKYSVGGSAGTLLVNGSIAQRWRGIVGQGSNGYTKLYRYDNRLQFATPPYFPKWANAKYTLRYSGEVNTPNGIRS
ncbi:hypothetical protein KIN34_13010 [Cellulomonas sp. DKR-3]|uniref:Type 4 fimbrial biogenesis protein PilX N-terminal domain-containing protein n=1 Tax=Cellulomonas fulva TaxID=2835530 RepID=A0ABS5U1C0_9CELL|nr:hypothetical protein [Cellulomonas fulva]MBT0995203.1 hypothetical protein [Cellulomonas fulva]